jgi:ADP-ribose pyrophosphatase YjhB (NUDIX family)
MPVHGNNELFCRHCNEFVWFNSKPTASIFLVRNRKVLLAKRAINPLKGYWDAPGGFLDYHEDPETGAKRELKEELGIRVTALHFLGIYLSIYGNRPGQSTFNVYYWSRSWKGVLRAHDDVQKFAWFNLASLPRRIAFSHNTKALNDLKKAVA